MSKIKKLFETKQQIEAGLAPSPDARINGLDPLYLVAVHLRHPLLGCPASASVKGRYVKDGRNVGLVLQFADGHTASLTYDEIGRLQADG